MASKSMELARQADDQITFSSIAELKAKTDNTIGDRHRAIYNGVDTLFEFTNDTADELGVLAGAGGSWTVQAGDNGYNLNSFGAGAGGDDKAAITAALTMGNTNSKAVHGVSGTTYLLDSGLSVTGSTVPASLDWNGCALKANSTFSGPVLSVNNPHSEFEDWSMGGVFIDCDNKAEKGFYLNGSQRAKYAGVYTVNATGDGNTVEGSSGAGVYYNEFGPLIASGCGGIGNKLFSKESEAAYRNSANNYHLVYSQFCEGDGIYLRYFQNQIWLGAEKNDGYGFNIDFTRDLTVSGGYAENNHQDKSDNGAGDGSDDWYALIGGDARGVKFLGGRFVGEIDPASTGIFGAGNEISPTNSTTKTLGMSVEIGDSSAPRDLDVSGDTDLTGSLRSRDVIHTLRGEDVTVPTVGTITISSLVPRAVYRAQVIQSSGGLNGEVATIVTDGSSNVSSITVEVTIGSNLTFLDDAGTLKISNGAGADRDANYTLLRLV